MTNNLRILGHLLLWTGFISAAVSMVSRKEVDMLPSAEQTALQAVDPQLSIPPEIFRQLINRPVEEMNEAEFIAAIGKINLWFQANSDDETQPKSKSNPITKSKLIQYRTRKVDNIWSVIPWLWYGISVAVGVVGVVLLRKTSQPRGASIAVSDDRELETLRQSLEQLLSHIKKLKSAAPKMHPEEIYQYIDDHCVTLFGDFADSRNVMTTQFGMAAFGEVMTEFASGERFINRAWSAAADGYVDEARDSIAKGLSFLEQAEKILRRFLDENR